MFGLLNLHKPTGCTSRRVVDAVQRLVKPHKVGHAGTLDPLASGVLVIGIGQATRLVEYIQEAAKTYRATFLLGRDSDTEDIEGMVTQRPNAMPPSLAALQQAAQALTGQIEQRPPAYSALKVAGQRAYALARAGQEVELAPRTIEIHRLTITRFEYPELELEVDCGSGTYIRSLGRDLAEAVGDAAVMSALERTSIGPFMLATAIDPASLSREQIERCLAPAGLALERVMPRYIVSGEDSRRLANGQTIALSQASSGPRLAAFDADGRLLAVLARNDDGSARPLKFFPAS